MARSEADLGKLAARLTRRALGSFLNKIDMETFKQIYPIVFLGGLGLFFLIRGLITIYKQQGPLMVRGKKPIANGKYAVWAGIGQIIISFSFFTFAVMYYSLTTCSVAFLILFIGTLVHFYGGAQDPSIDKEIKEQLWL